MKTRKELYAEIKKYNLENETYNAYGKNYTNISNENLECIINDYLALNKKAKTCKTCQPDKYMTRLLDVLERNHILIKSQVDEILGK